MSILGGENKQQPGGEKVFLNEVETVLTPFLEKDKGQRQQKPLLENYVPSPKVLERYFRLAVAKDDPNGFLKQASESFPLVDGNSGDALIDQIAEVLRKAFANRWAAAELFALARENMHDSWQRAILVLGATASLMQFNNLLAGKNNPEFDQLNEEVQKLLFRL